MEQGIKEMSQKGAKLREIASDFQCQLLVNQPLSRYTTIGIGGAAPFMLFPFKEENLQVLFAALKEESLSWRVIGGGSNIIVNDNGIKEIIINLSKLDFKPHFEGEVARVPAGFRLEKFVREAAHRGLGGVEFLSGIPGCLGGAIKMNAGSFGGSIAGILSQVEMISSDGKRELRGAKELSFDYRFSSIKQADVVLAAQFKLKREKKQHIREKIELYLNSRKENQPLGERSAGCIFKNPPSYFAGQLIDELGLKGLSSGGAMISEKHANFIINREKARFEDVMKLINIIKQKVQKHMGIELEEEVEIWN